MNLKKLTLLLISLFYLSFNELRGQWIPSSGIEGASVSDLVVLDSSLFICTGINGIFERNVNGGVWEQKSSEQVSEIIKCQSTLFAWGVFSCYRSLDHGLTWQNMSNTWNVVGYVTSMCTIDSTLFFAVRGPIAAVYRSDNFGDSIYPIFNIQNPSMADINITVGDGSTLICYQKVGDRALFESNDQGYTWDSITTLGHTPENYETFSISKQGSVYWHSTTSGLYVKNNIQENWILADSSLWLTKMNLMNGTLFGTGYNGGFWRLNPVTSQWIPENTGLETTSVNGFCSAGNLMFLATVAGPYKCISPYSWLPFYDGLNMSQIYNIACLGNEVLAVTPRGMFVSSNHGGSFTKQEFAGMGIPDKMILSDSVFYALAGRSFYCSLDHGNTWIKKHDGLPAPQQPPLLYIESLVKNSNYLFIGTNMGLYRSPVSLINWEKVTSIGTVVPISYNLYCDDSILLVGKYVYTNTYHCPNFRSSDSGQSFDSIVGLPDAKWIFSNDGADFFALYNNILYNSQDYGVTWQQIPFGNTMAYGYFLASSKPAVIVGGSKLSITLYDLYLSVTYDNGLTWTDIQGNLPVPGWPIFTLVETYQERTYVSPLQKGLWYRDGILTGIQKDLGSYSEKMEIFPNPAGSYAEIRIDLPETAVAGIVVYDVKGRVYQMFKNLKLLRGNNRIPLNVNSFTPGLYLVSLMAGNKNYSRRLLVMED